MKYERKNGTVSATTAKKQWSEVNKKPKGNTRYLKALQGKHTTALGMTTPVSSGGKVKVPRKP